MPKGVRFDCVWGGGGSGWSPDDPSGNSANYSGFDLVAFVAWGLHLEATTNVQVITWDHGEITESDKPTFTDVGIRPAFPYWSGVIQGWDKDHPLPYIVKQVPIGSQFNPGTWDLQDVGTTKKINFGAGPPVYLTFSVEKYTGAFVSPFYNQPLEAVGYVWPDGTAMFSANTSRPYHGCVCLFPSPKP